MRGICETKTMALNKIFLPVAGYWLLVTRYWTLNSIQHLRAWVWCVRATQWDSRARWEMIANKQTAVTKCSSLDANLCVPHDSVRPSTYSTVFCEWKWFRVICCFYVWVPSVSFVTTKSQTKKICFITLLPNAYRLMEFVCFRRRHTSRHTVDRTTPIPINDLLVDDAICFFPRGVNGHVTNGNVCTEKRKTKIIIIYMSILHEPLEWAICCVASCWASCVLCS